MPMLASSRLMVGLMLAVAVSSQNILPIHIAFIPLLVPPLLYVLTRLRIDRRLIACVITFGLITPTCSCRWALATFSSTKSCWPTWPAPVST